MTDYNRATLYHNLDKIIDYVKKANEPVTGDFFSTKEERFALNIKPQPEFSLNDRLWGERRALGGFISDHPMSLVRGRRFFGVPDWAKVGAKKRLRDVPDLLDGPTVPTNLAFFVHDWFIVKGKFLVMNASDETAPAEINGFVSDCDPWWSLIKPNFILIAQCVPRHSGKFSSMNFLKLHKLGELTRPLWAPGGRRG